MNDANVATNADLIAADLLAALKGHAIPVLLDALGSMELDPAKNWRFVLIRDAVNNAETKGIRSQSFADRERDLLAANNRHLEDARTLRRRVAYLEERETEMTRGFVGQFISMGRRTRQQRDALKALLPYAESRAEDMQEEVDAFAMDHPNRPEAADACAKAIDAVNAAKLLLGMN